MELTTIAPVMLIANGFMAYYRKSLTEAKDSLREYENALKTTYEATFKAAFDAIEIDSVDDNRLQDSAKSFRKVNVALFQNSRISSFRKTILGRMRFFHLSLFILAVLTVAIGLKLQYFTENPRKVAVILIWSPTGIAILQVLMAFYVEKIKEYFIDEKDELVDR